MSKLVDDFETRMAHGLPMFPMNDVFELIAHAKALETMLAKQFEDGHIGGDVCIICDTFDGHSPDCALSALLHADSR